MFEINRHEIKDKSEVKIDYLWWQKRGLSFTASGYGKQIPTEYKIKAENKWYRVYCCIFSNSGTLYIKSKGRDIIITNEEILSEVEK